MAMDFLPRVGGRARPTGGMDFSADPVHPRAEVAPRPEAAQGGERLEECLLRQIFRGVPVASELVQPAVQAIPVALDQPGERRAVARLCGSDPLGLVAARRRVEGLGFERHAAAVQRRVKEFQVIVTIHRVRRPSPAARLILNS